MGHVSTGPPPRKRGLVARAGVHLSPPMRAWLKQPHGRRHKAPPQPCALTTTTTGDGKLIARASAVLKSQQGRRKLVPWETRPPLWARKNNAHNKTPIIKSIGHHATKWPQLKSRSEPRTHGVRTSSKPPTSRRTQHTKPRENSSCDSSVRPGKRPVASYNLTYGHRHQRPRLEPDHRSNCRCPVNLSRVVRGRPKKAGSGRGGCQRTPNESLMALFPCTQQQQKNDFFALFLVFFATDICCFAITPSTMTPIRYRM